MLVAGVEFWSGEQAAEVADGAVQPATVKAATGSLELETFEVAVGFGELLDGQRSQAARWPMRERSCWMASMTRSGERRDWVRPKERPKGSELR